MNTWENKWNSKFYVTEQERVTKLLLEKGGDSNALNNTDSALISALRLRKSLNLLEFDKVAELLVEKGMDVNIVGQNGSTALMYAAGGGEKWVLIPSQTAFLFVHSFWGRSTFNIQSSRWFIVLNKLPKQKCNAERKIATFWFLSASIPI